MEQEDKISVVVTDRGLETPRGTSINLQLGGKAQVCCIHQREKRQVVTLELKKGYFLQICPCCENMFYHRTDMPHFCDGCGGRKVPGGEHLPKGKG